ncbi:MAG: CPBP family intramembrane glutamic endopeptidase [bacterium]
MAAPASLERSPVPAWIGLLCALIVIIPYYGMAILSGIAIQREGLTELPGLTDTLLQALLITAVFCGLTWALLRFICREEIGSLNPGRTSFGIDLLHAINMSALLLLAQIAVGLATGVQATQEGGFNNLLADQLHSSPLALFVWAGPVAWLQAGLTEEFTRAFILTRLWKMWPAQPAQFLSLVLMSALFGMGHYYQGVNGVIGTALIGLVFGFHYMRFGSLRAIILGHGLYDTIVMLLLWWGSKFAM